MHTIVFVIMRKREFFRCENEDYLTREFWFTKSAAQEGFATIKFKTNCDGPVRSDFDEFEIVEAQIIDTKTLEYDSEMAAG